jgi:hypothetical protein
MFPSTFPLALLIQTALICVTVLIALSLTGNPLALAGLLLVRPIETFMPEGLCNDPNAENVEDPEDHQNREAGFNAKHE